jgi:osmotically-inducible protein OsmY
MKKLASMLLIPLLLYVTAAFAQQTPTESNPGRASGQSSAPSTSKQAGTQSGSPSIQEQKDAQGGAPNSPIPGRVTGATPTQVQEALDRQLPANAQVTASVADDGSLKLTGTVRSEADKAKAEQIAKQTSNKTINNQIQVKSAAVWDEKPKN